MLQREKENFGFCAAAALMQGPLLAYLLSEKPVWEPWEKKGWNCCSLVPGAALELRSQTASLWKWPWNWNFFLHFSTKGKVDFSGGKTGCLAQKELSGCLEHKSSFTSQQKKRRWKTKCLKCRELKRRMSAYNKILLASFSGFCLLQFCFHPTYLV